LHHGFPLCRYLHYDVAITKLENAGRPRGEFRGARRSVERRPGSSAERGYGGSQGGSTWFEDCAVYRSSCYGVDLSFRGEPISSMMQP
jgi:hypothetical protein